MDHFNYIDNELFAENVSVSKIAQDVGTPFYLYSTSTLIRHYNVFCNSFAGKDFLLCYAVKANTNQAVIKTFANQGAGADVVSGGELRRALKAGIDPQKIVFSGVAKTEDEMALALEAGIFQFNVESEPELQALNKTALKLGKIAPIAYRINPDVDPKTHAKITTGKSENKFGIPISKARELYSKASKLEGIKVQGVDLHIGSQLTDLNPFEEAFTRIATLIEALRADGHTVSVLDLGGGLGVPYNENKSSPPLPEEYAKMVDKTVGHLGCKIIIEPGRLLVANAGILVSKVIYVKEGENKKFLIIDAAMNDLVRPTMYDAFHEIVPINNPNNETTPYDVVGPVCETGDTFAKDREIPTVYSGDLVAIRSVGAYGAVLASTYNTRPLIPEVMVNEDQYSIIRERPSYEDILGLDKDPDWL